MRSLLRFPVVAGLLLVVVLLAVGAALLFRGGGPTGGDNHTPGFRNLTAAESGINFRTTFLSDEQGANFKINLYDHGSGVAVGDFDGDGHDDIYFVNQLGPNALYRNKGDGTFEDVTDKAHVGLGDRICTGATWADYDNDGKEDLFVTSTRGGNVLFHNNGDGTFTNVTEKAHLDHVGHSQMAVFFDYDNDGYLDLLVLQTAKWTTDAVNPADRHYAGKGSLQDTAQSEIEHNILYHNDHDGTFSEVKNSGLEGLGWAGDAAVFDYDGDGKPDVLITNMFGRAQLYHNDGGGKFSDVTLAVLGKTSWGGMGARAFDADNDGRLDLYIVDMHSDMWTPSDMDVSEVRETTKFPHLMGGRYRGPEDDETERGIAGLMHVKYDEVLFGNTFFHNEGGGKFKEISDKANLETFWPWGITVGDFDNDGFQDVFEPAGMGFPFFPWPDYLLMNKGDGTFENRAKKEGIDPPNPAPPEEIIAGRVAPRSSRAAAVADFDGDGRLDLIVNNFNGPPYYFKNQFPKRNYVAFRLSGNGKSSNRDAIGATVTLHIGKEVMIRQVDPAAGYLSQSSKTLHFGLGDRTAIDRAEIRWPDGRVRTVEHPEINRLHDFAEPDE